MMNYVFLNELAILSPGVKEQKYELRNLSTRWVTADMVLGNANIGCRGAGICKISVQEKRQDFIECGCECIPVFLTQVNSHWIQFILEKRSLSFANRVKHFGGNQVTVHKAISLSSQLSVELGSQTSISIAAQNITIYEDEHYYCFFMSILEV
ncbi:MAG: hypothetical protein AB8H12_09890 [Lewinella sp.]